MTWATRRKGGCVHYCMPGLDPDLGRLSDLVYTYIPTALISVVPAQLLATELADAENPPMVPDDDEDGRYGWATFADRQQLLDALELVTPPEVRAELGSLEGPPAANAGEGWTGALTDGVSWWALALAAGGVLAWLGRRHIAGFILSVGVERLFRSLVVGGVALALAPRVLEVLDAAKGAAMDTISMVPYVVGGVAVLGLVVGGVLLMRRRPRRLIA